MIGFAALAWVFPVDPWSLVRVDDPAHPDAVATSATGAVLLAPPPPGTPWTTEVVPVPDAWISTETLDALAAGPWHDDGATGAGVRVAVFDLQWFGDIDPDELGSPSTHDCWLHPSCEVPLDVRFPRFAFETGVHGFACAEVLHDVAPGAELFLVRVNGRTTFENAVEWAIRNDIDVISLSMSFTAASFHDGTGPVNRLARRAAEAGILLVTSAGNYADAHWGGPWSDGDRDGRLDFDGDGSLDVWLTPGMGAVLVQWDQHQACGLTDLDAYLFDADGDLVARGEDPQVPGADRCEPVERLRPAVTRPQWGRLEVHHRRGGLVDLDVDVVSLTTPLRNPDPYGSIADPASTPSALTVAAVRADGYLDNDVEPFSSWADPTRTPDTPDLAGPDGVSTDAYGAGAFFGTSAAAPAVAGAVALWMERTGVDALAAAEALEATARDGRPVWEPPDPRWGAGKVRLPDPASPAAGCTGRASLWLVGLGPVAWWRRRRTTGARFG